MSVKSLSKEQIALLRAEAASIKKTSVQWAKKYGISSSYFLTLMRGHPHLGSRYSAQRVGLIQKHEPRGNGRAQLVRPDTRLEKAAKAAMNLAKAGGTEPQLKRSLVASHWSVNELSTMKDQADRLDLISKVLRDEKSTLRQLEDVASTCGFLVDVRFKSV